MRASILLRVALASLVLSLSLTEAHAQVLQLPNLVALPPTDVHVGPPDDFEPSGVMALRFSSASGNIGAYALELHGDLTDHSDASGDTALKKAQECVWWVSRVCTQTVPIGDFAWSPEHGHYHYENYMGYALRKVRGDMQPNMSPDGLVSAGDKAGFCLLDGGQDGNPPGYDPLRGVPLYAMCTSYFQGLSPSRTDGYSYALYGQQILFDSTSVQDGTYALVITVNPGLTLLESNTEDNAAFVLVQISDGGATARQIELSSAAHSRL